MIQVQVNRFETRVASAWGNTRFGASCRLVRQVLLGQHVLDDMTVDIGQTSLDTVVIKRQTFVIESH